MIRSHFLHRPVLLQACLGLSLIAFCAASAMIRWSGPHAPDAAGYGFAYTGSGLQLGAQIWSAFGSPPFWLLKARAYERAGDLDDAAEAWRAAVRVSGFDAAIGLDYARFLQRYSNAGETERFLVDLYRRRPGNPGVLAMLGQIELSLRQWDKADSVAAAIRKLDPSGPVADQIAAAALIGRGELDKAVEVYRRLAQQFPTTASATALATALVAAHKPAEAAKVLEADIASHPGNAQALVILGWIADSGGRGDEAREKFRLAIERQPNSNAGYLALARLDMRERRLDEAIATLRAGRSAVPDDPIVAFELAGGLQSAKRYDEAIAAYDDMLRSNPGMLVAVNNLAVLLTDYRRDPASLARAEELAATLDRAPVSQFLDTRGWVSYRLGRYETATALLERAAAEAPDRPAVRYHLGMAYLARHDSAKAAVELKAAAALNPDPELAAEIGKALTAAGR